MTKDEYPHVRDQELTFLEIKALKAETMLVSIKIVCSLAFIMTIAKVC